MEQRVWCKLGPSTSSRVLRRLLVSVQKGYGSESIVFELGVALVHLQDLT